MHCCLGLDCTQMGLDEGGECINEESCYRYTEAWNLYEIVLLKGLPGAVYICWPGRDANTEWRNEQWGFKHLNNCDWLHYTASLNTLAQWQHAYYKLSSRKNTKYVPSDLFDEFEALRTQVDTEYGKRQESSALILFE
ncbi:hypothetical protein QUA35_05705 [Microcoleus sp. N9_B2]|uniref:hypothetical protein n=1 Tax=unclassified Microcoleus TaxID=2642155 RepID=UPI002FD12458